MSRYRTRPGAWSEAEHQQLRELYPVRRTREVARLLGRSLKSASSRAKVLGLKKSPGAFGAKTRWTLEQDRQVRKFYPHTSTAKLAERVGHSLLSTYRRAHQLGLHKTQEYLDSPVACRLRRGDNVGWAHRFEKGQVPHNKGLRRPGWFRGRMRETQFKKGKQPRNTMCLWSFRVNTDGYLLLKTGKPGAKPNDGWEWVHKLVWEHAHGPIPEGHRIWWKDRDHLNNSLANLELLSGADHAARMTIHNLPPELKQVIQLTGAINRAITMRGRKSEEQDRRSA